jgi:uncharacterized membrane protein YphA (DoxX/SURF4 family)
MDQLQRLAAVMRLRSRIVGDICAWLVAVVWLVHGGWNKLLGGSPRHLAIVQAIPGFEGVAGERVLAVVGGLEVFIALWIVSGWMPRLCATTQTVALLSMNVIELAFARHVLLWPAGLIPANLLFLSLAWIAARSTRGSSLRAWLRRHPIAIEAHFRDCLALTYAVPAAVLRPLLPPGLELETLRGYGFLAVALVQTESLRPAGFPKRCGQDFFLSGYRVFVRFRTPEGKSIRGLRILRSDANRWRMVMGGNLLTHYNYHQCSGGIDSSQDRIRVQTSRVAMVSATWLWRPTRRAQHFQPDRRFAHGERPATLRGRCRSRSITRKNPTRSSRFTQCVETGSLSLSRSTCSRLLSSVSRASRTVRPFLPQCSVSAISIIGGSAACVIP